ncbi:MAG: DoxX family protein [Phaeodactylibacter sp.]|nr:DoxX family protein [Phaeodactylibacter sp.]MCB9266562.1 DoxX family protein [Lewinellaceae bacterium]MCB9288636.1 DoxX family protein [Lewinellaceae bacterium]
MVSRKQNDLALLLLRLTFGGAMIYNHGWGKLMRLLSGEPIKFFDFMGLGPELSLGLATFAEVGCSLLLILGLFTRWAAIPLIITMMVAISTNLGEGFGQIEKALLFLMAYVALQLTGPGWYSLDAQVRNRG